MEQNTVKTPHKTKEYNLSHLNVELRTLLCTMLFITELFRGQYPQARPQYKSQVTSFHLFVGSYSSVLWGSRKQVSRVKQEISGEAENEVAKNQPDGHGRSLAQYQ